MRGERELESAVRSLSSALAAGLNLDQALAVAATQAPPALRQPLGRAAAAYRLGAPLPSALAVLAPHCPAAELDLLIRAVALGLRCGGSLPRLLGSLALVLQERRLLRAELAARSSEARWSARLLAALPPLLAIYLAGVNPGMLAPFWRLPAGRTALVIAIAWWGLGAGLLWRLVRPPELR